MVSKNRIKYLRSLASKKNRDADGVFIAEGPRLVSDLANWFEPVEIVTEQRHASLFESFSPSITTAEVLAQISLLKNHQGVFAVFHKRKCNIADADSDKMLVLALDGIQDPGNLGTIIRTADWFGVEHIVCSNDTVDVYNPKVIQATMGAVARVSVHYTNLASYLSTRKCAIYGAFLEGESIYETTFGVNGVLVMGNEGNGVSEEIENLVTKKIHIPPYPADRKSSESLNVATATAIICAEIRRKM